MINIIIYKVILEGTIIIDVFLFYCNHCMYAHNNKHNVILQTYCFYETSNKSSENRIELRVF